MYFRSPQLKDFLTPTSVEFSNAFRILFWGYISDQFWKTKIMDVNSGGNEAAPDRLSCFVVHDFFNFLVQHLCLFVSISFFKLQVVFVSLELSFVIVFTVTATFSAISLDLILTAHLVFFLQLSLTLDSPLVYITVFVLFCIFKISLNSIFYDSSQFSKSHFTNTFTTNVALCYTVCPQDISVSTVESSCYP